MDKKIAIVVQRYGLEVNGGAEFHARILAEQLVKRYSVEVLSSTALDYHGWDNYYPEGPDLVNGIAVRRFSTFKQRKKITRQARRAIYKKKKYFMILKFLGVFNRVDKAFRISKITQQNIDKWLIGQGPYVPDLIEYISENKNRFDVFIFFTYLYYPTVVGMPIVAEKSIFVPTAHDEPILYTKPYENIFSLPRFIMYNTECERSLVEKHFKTSENVDVAGLGITPYAGKFEKLPENLTSKKYFIYIGRIDLAKGCDKMIHYFLQFKKSNPQYNDYKLVVVGKNYMKKTYHDSSVFYTGFVSEELKHTYLYHALAMIMPSYYESLSLVTLEAMAAGVPVIVNRSCAVLYDHIVKSNTGASFDDQQTFTSSLQKYIDLSEDDHQKEKLRAQKYVTDSFDWKTVLAKFDRAVDMIVTAKKEI